jgi:hypothetical protein
MDAVREQVAAMVAEGRRRGDLDAFLDELEATARRQGRVTAVELLAGLAAIDHAAPEDLDRATSFARRMERVARELGAPASSADAPAGSGSAEDLVEGVRAATPGIARDELIPAAIAELSRLPLEEQPAAFAALDRATAAGLSSPPAAATLDGRIAEIAAATDGPSRSRLVQGFVRDVDTLRPEEQERWLRELDRATARR